MFIFGVNSRECIVGDVKARKVIKSASEFRHCTIEGKMGSNYAGTKWFWGKFGSCHIE
jgi:hypothetical protein